MRDWFIPKSAHPQHLRPHHEQPKTAITRFVSVAVLALLSAAAISVVEPSRARATGRDLICPDPVTEGDSAQMGVRDGRNMMRGLTIYTHRGDHTASFDDFTAYRGTWFETEDATLWIPIETTEDTRIEHNETFSVGFFAHGSWYACVVTIVDDDQPRIIGVDFASSPTVGFLYRAYRAGDAVDVAVRLDKNVEVEGSPLLALSLGDSGSSTWRGARYHSGSGSRELVFRYRVQPEDLDFDGLSVAAAATAEDRTPAYGFTGTINAAGTDIPIDYTHPGIESVWRQKVDGRPYVQSTRIISVPEAGQGTYRANEVIEVAFTFNTAVVVEGDVCVELYVGYDGYHSNSVREANYHRGSGTDTLEFGYTIRPGDMDSRGIMVALGTETTGFCGSGTIKAHGTDAQRNPSYLDLDSQREHRVDTEPPAASAVSIVSRPADGDAYAAGETIIVAVAFSEEVTVSGAPHIELDIGGETRRATLAASQGTSSRIAFEYEVQSGDADDDGVGISANSLRLNGGDIHDRAGNLADLSYDTVAADPDQRVSTSIEGAGS